MHFLVGIYQHSKKGQSEGCSPWGRIPYRCETLEILSQEKKCSISFRASNCRTFKYCYYFTPWNIFKFVVYIPIYKKKKKNRICSRLFCFNIIQIMVTLNKCSRIKPHWFSFPRKILFRRMQMWKCIYLLIFLPRNFINIDMCYNNLNHDIIGSKNLFFIHSKHLGLKRVMNVLIVRWNCNENFKLSENYMNSCNVFLTIL